jgi:hypothetical protein
MLDTPPPSGHNFPPPYDPSVIALFKPRINAFAETAGQWLDMGEIESEEDAARLNDFLNGARKLFKEIDAARVEAKKPHDVAAKEVQTVYSALLDVVTKTAEKPKPLLARFLERKRVAEEQERARKKAVADALAKEAADRATMAAMQNDVVGEAEAEAAAKEAAKLQKQADKPVNASIGSATGGGRTMSQRTIRDVRLVNINKAFMEFRESPEVAEVLTTLARRRVRAGDFDGAEIPGFERDDKTGVA